MGPTTLAGLLIQSEQESDQEQAMSLQDSSPPCLEPVQAQEDDLHDMPTLEVQAPLDLADSLQDLQQDTTQAPLQPSSPRLSSLGHTDAMDILLEDVHESKHHLSEHHLSEHHLSEHHLSEHHLSDHDHLVVMSSDVHQSEHHLSEHDHLVVMSSDIHQSEHHLSEHDHLVVMSSDVRQSEHHLSDHDHLVVMSSDVHQSEHHLSEHDHLVVMSSDVRQSEHHLSDHDHLVVMSGDSVHILVQPYQTLQHGLSPVPMSTGELSPDLVKQPSQHECMSCKKPIADRFFLKAMDQFWHEDCLKCSCCDCRLGEVGSTLFSKANLLLCRRDYLRLFGTTGYCAACKKMIPAFEMVMRAKHNVYHLECFACQQCMHRFCVGDRFYLADNKILCEFDYEERMMFANLGTSLHQSGLPNGLTNGINGCNGAPGVGVGGAGGAAGHYGYSSYNALTQIKRQTQSLSDDVSSGYGSPSPSSL